MQRNNDPISQPKQITVICTDHPVSIGDILKTRSHASESLEPLDISDALSFEDLNDRWCGVFDDTIAEAFLQKARQILPIGPTSSVIELEWLTESAIGAGASDEAIETARVLLSILPAPANEMVQSGLSHLRASGITEGELFSKLASVWGCRWLCALVKQPSDRLIQLLQHIVPAVAAGTTARFILVIEQPAWHELQHRLDPHTLALLTEHMIDPNENRLISVSPMPAAGSIDALQQQASRAVESAKNAAPAVPKLNKAASEIENARSLAEALLYTALQSDARTTGLFRLNADGGFQFGNRPVEIDLLCEVLRIAIEVDGYFHFQDNIAYRRDRAKDFLLQLEGFLVLRFLAEDVTERLDYILSRIFKAVKLRESGEGAN